jgi:hypothetical protein
MKFEEKSSMREKELNFICNLSVIENYRVARCVCIFAKKSKEGFGDIKGNRQVLVYPRSQ